MATTMVPAEGGSWSFNAADGTQEFFFTPTSSSTVKIFTTGDVNADTYIDLYTYPAYGYIADDDTSGQDGTHASITVNLQGGVDYTFFVQIPTRPASFNYTLTVDSGSVIAPPPYIVGNDNLAGATLIADYSGSAPYDNTGATTEISEPSPNNMSTWYTWIAGSEEGREFVYIPSSTDPKDQIVMRSFTTSPLFPNPVSVDQLVRAKAWADPADPNRMQVKTIPGQRYWIQTSTSSGSYGNWGFGTINWQGMIWGPWQKSAIVSGFADIVPLTRQSGGGWHFPDGGLRTIDLAGNIYYGPPTDNTKFAPSQIKQLTGTSWQRDHPDQNTGAYPPDTNPPEVGAGKWNTREFGTIDTYMRVSNNWQSEHQGGPIKTEGPVRWHIESTIEQHIVLYDIRTTVIRLRANPPVTTDSVGGIYEADPTYVDPEEINLKVSTTKFGRCADPWELEVRRFPKERRRPEDIVLAEPYGTANNADTGIGRGHYGTGVRAVQNNAFVEPSDQLVGNFNWIPHEEHTSFPLMVSIPSTKLGPGTIDTVVLDTMIPPSHIDSEGWIGFCGLHSRGRLGQWSTTTSLEQYPNPDLVKGRDNWAIIRAPVLIRVQTRYRKLTPGKNIEVPMRQRHRNDGLATDAREFKGFGSSLQISIRRGGRTYY